MSFKDFSQLGISNLTALDNQNSQLQDNLKKQDLRNVETHSQPENKSLEIISNNQPEKVTVLIKNDSEIETKIKEQVSKLEDETIKEEKNEVKFNLSLDISSSSLDQKSETEIESTNAHSTLMKNTIYENKSDETCSTQEPKCSESKTAIGNGEEEVSLIVLDDETYASKDETSTSNQLVILNTSQIEEKRKKIKSGEPLIGISKSGKSIIIIATKDCDLNKIHNDLKAQNNLIKTERCIQNTISSVQQPEKSKIEHSQECNDLPYIGFSILNQNSENKIDQQHHTNSDEQKENVEQAVKNIHKSENIENETITTGHQITQHKSESTSDHDKIETENCKESIFENDLISNHIQNNDNLLTVLEIPVEKYDAADSEASSALFENKKLTENKNLDETDKKSDNLSTSKVNVEATNNITYDEELPIETTTQNNDEELQTEKVDKETPTVSELNLSIDNKKDEILSDSTKLNNNETFSPKNADSNVFLIQIEESIDDELNPKNSKMTSSSTDKTNSELVSKIHNHFEKKSHRKLPTKEELKLSHKDYKRRDSSPHRQYTSRSSSESIKENKTILYYKRDAESLTNETKRRDKSHADKKILDLKKPKESPAKSSQKIRDIFDTTLKKSNVSQPTPTYFNKSSITDRFVSPFNDSCLNKSSSRIRNTNKKYFNDFYANIKDDDEDIYGNKVPCKPSTSALSSYNNNSTSNSNNKRENSVPAKSSDIPKEEENKKRKIDAVSDDEEDKDIGIPKILKFANKQYENVKNKLMKQNSLSNASNNNKKPWE
jgi:hypothetical protein